MEDLIKREDAIKIIERCKHRLEGNGSTYQIMLDMIKDIPSAENKGEWILHKGIWVDEDYYPTTYECNQCHHFVVAGSDRNFCPNCGARMKQ